MRILVLNYEYPPIGGGAANATKHLVHEWAKQGLIVDVITSSQGGYQEESPVDGVRIFRLDVAKKEVHHWRLSEIFRWMGGARYEMRRLHEEHPYDIVVALPSSPCGFLAYQLNVPFVLCLRGSDVPGFNPRLKLIDTFGAWVYRRLWAAADAVVANSAGLAALAHKTSDVDIDVIPNGVSRLPQHTPTQTRRPRLLFVGRLVGRKGLQDALSALQGLDASLTVVGDGVMREELEALAQDLDVTFLGAQPHTRVNELYAQHDVFIQTSYHEGMSNTMLEALSAGLPMIMSSCEGSEEIFCGNGVLVSAGDVDAIREAIIVLQDPQMRAECAQKSALHAQQFTWESVAEQYHSLFLRL